MTEKKDRTHRRHRREQDHYDQNEFRRRTPSRSTSLLSVANQPTVKISLKVDNDAEDSAQAQMLEVSSYFQI